MITPLWKRRNSSTQGRLVLLQCISEPTMILWALISGRSIWRLLFLFFFHETVNACSVISRFWTRVRLSENISNAYRSYIRPAQTHPLCLLNFLKNQTRKDLFYFTLRNRLLVGKSSSTTLKWYKHAPSCCQAEFCGNVVERPFAKSTSDASGLVLQPFPATNSSECSHWVWSRNGREGCFGLQHGIIVQMVFYSSSVSGPNLIISWNRENLKERFGCGTGNHEAVGLPAGSTDALHLRHPRSAERR